MVDIVTYMTIFYKIKHYLYIAVYSIPEKLLLIINVDTDVVKAEIIAQEHPKNVYEEAILGTEAK